jgi:S-DNA-T family DNA segregation ATPase FtsK/SpoIIIE
MVPLLMGAALWVATGSVASALFVLFSFVFVLASGIEARREARAEDRFRVAEFDEDLQECLTTLGEMAERQRREHDRLTPAPTELLARVEHDPQRVWQRGSEDAQLLVVRVGTATTSLEAPLVRPTGGRRDLRRTMSTRVEAARRLDDVVLVDLSASTGLAVIGGDETTTDVARSVLVQAVTLVGPDQLSVELVHSAEREHHWRWCRWLPHLLPTPGVAITLLVADGVRPDEVAEAAERCRARGSRAVVLWVGVDAGLVPSGVGAVLGVRDADAGGARLVHDGVLEAEGILLEPLSTDEAEPLARRLASLRPSVAPAITPAGRRHVAAPLPVQVQLADVVGTADVVGDVDSLVRHWTRDVAPSARRSLHVPLGRAASTRGTAVLGVDLVDDGPHALVAGTTGSGKSELLRTMVLGAALHHGPDRVHFLLVDYKGGAAFGPLTELPHTVGLITDLTPELATRALISLRAEVRRREQELATTGRSDWVGPALVVVVDEFATLARELPDFVDGVVDLAQRGRSLGVHLVLATQRPAGVVTDAIRANTSLRVALRVTDEDESRDVVDDPAAAALPRDAPGRAVVRVGPGPVTTFQAAYCGAPQRAAERVRVHAWDQPQGPAPATAAGHAAADATGCDTAGPSELEVGVATARAAARRLALAAPRRPWIDPLPAPLDWSQLDGCGPGPAPGVSIGLVDVPALQTRRALRVDLARDGGLLVLGTGGSGRSGALAALVAALGRSEAATWQVHVVDVDGSLAGLRGEPTVGDVISVHDVERVTRLLRGAVAELDRRLEAGAGSSVGADVGRRLLVLDGFGAFEELYERMDRGVVLDLLARLARDGRSVGLHLALSAARPGEVPVGIAGCLGARLQLRCTTADDALMAGLGVDAADAELPAGRCWVDGHAAQVADVRTASAAPSRPVVPGVARLPASLQLSALASHPSSTSDDATAQRLAIALDADLLEPATLDLARHVVVAGPPRSGRSTALRTIAAAHDAARPNGRSVLVARDGLEELAGTVDEVLGVASAGRPTLLALDDVDEALEGRHGEEVELQLARLLDAAHDAPVRLAIAGDADGMLRCYRDVVTRLRAGRCGVLLGADPDTHSALLHTALRSRSDLPVAPGRGWLVTHGHARAVQLALPD